MGRPANTPFSPRALAHSGKAVATLFENLALIRLARRAQVAFMGQNGESRSQAATTTGTATKPPLEKTMSGLIFPSR